MKDFAFDLFCDRGWMLHSCRTNLNPLLSSYEYENGGIRRYIFSRFSSNQPHLISLSQLDELFLRPKSNELKCSSSLKEGGKNVHSEPDEAFAFDRTISRLKEMGGSAYLMKYGQLP